MKNNKGFSLVELIIVIAIMAVLVIVLAPTFLKFVEKGRETTDMDNVTMVKEAIQVYVADHGLKGTDTFTVSMKSGANEVIKVTTTATSLSGYSISNKILPGLTTATQYSGLPLPLPIRVSAGFAVIGLSGKILIQT